LSRAIARCLHPKCSQLSAVPFCSVPADQIAFRIPRLARGVARGAVVLDTAVGRPRVGPVERDAQTARVGIVAPPHEVALLRPGAGDDPAAAGGLAVACELPEAVQLLAGLA